MILHHLFCFTVSPGLFQQSNSFFVVLVMIHLSPVILRKSWKSWLLPHNAGVDDYCSLFQPDTGGIKDHNWMPLLINFSWMRTSPLDTNFSLPNKPLAILTFISWKNKISGLNCNQLVSVVFPEQWILIAVRWNGSSCLKNSTTLYTSNHTTFWNICSNLVSPMLLLLWLLGWRSN